MSGTAKYASVYLLLNSSSLLTEWIALAAWTLFQAPDSRRVTLTLSTLKGVPSINGSSNSRAAK